MRTRITFTIFLVAAVMIACAPPTADDLVAQVIAIRNNFEVNLSSWIDRGTETGPPYL